MVLKYIVKVTYEIVYEARDEEEAQQFALIHLSQVMGKNIKAFSEVLPDDQNPCAYGKLNRTCDGTKCKICEREDWLQAMNEDAADERMGLVD